MIKRIKNLIPVILCGLFALSQVNVQTAKTLDVFDIYEENRIAKMVPKAAHQANGLISDVKVQITPEIEGKRNIRFVVAIDSSDYTSATFNLNVQGMGNVNMGVSLVYEAIYAGGKLITPQSVFDDNYNYFLLGELIDYRASEYANSISVSATIINANTGLTSTSSTRNLSVQEIIDIENNVEYTEAVLPLHDTDPYSFWGNNSFKVQWKQLFTYEQLTEPGTDDASRVAILAQKVKVTIEYGLDTYQTTMDRRDGDRAFAGSFVNFPNATNLHYIVHVAITHETVIYRASFHARNNKIYRVSDAIADALAELNQFMIANLLLEEKYGSNLELFQQTVNDVKAAIQASTTHAEVEIALEEAKAALLAVEQPALDISGLKAVAKAELAQYINETYLKVWYTNENWNYLFTIGHSEIDAATTEEELNLAVAEAKAAIDSVETVTQPITFTEVQPNLERNNKEILVRWNAGNGLTASANIDNQLVDARFSIGDTSYGYSAKRTVYNGVAFAPVPELVANVGMIGSITYTLTITVVQGNRTYVGVSRCRNSEGRVTVDQEKTNIKNEMEKYVADNFYIEEKYTPENWILFQEAMLNFENNINAATSFYEIDIANQTAFDAIAAVPQIDFTFEELKAVMFAYVCKVLENEHLYDEENWKAVLKLIDFVEFDIDVSDTIDEMNDYIRQFFINFYKVEQIPTYLKISQTNNYPTQNPPRVGVRWDNQGIGKYKDLEPLGAVFSVAITDAYGVTHTGLTTGEWYGGILIHFPSLEIFQMRCHVVVKINIKGVIYVIEFEVENGAIDAQYML